VYAIVFTSLMILSFKDIFINLNLKYKSKNIMIAFICIILSFIAGVRFYIGVDYGTYLQVYNGINNINDYNYIEIGFRIITLIVKLVFDSEIAYFFIFAFLGIAYASKGIKNESNAPYMSFFIYFCIFYINYIFNGMRQGVVMGIFVYSLKYFRTNEFKKVLFISLISLSIHSSGIYIMIAYFIRNIELKYKYYWIILFVGILLCLYNPLESILSKIHIFGISQKINSYNNTFLGSLDMIGILQRVLILLIFILNINLINKNSNAKQLLNIYVLGWIAYCLFSFQSMLATRINMFFRIIEIILLPYVSYNIKNRPLKLVIFIIIILWCGILLVSQLDNYHNFPYKWRL